MFVFLRSWNLPIRNWIHRWFFSIFPLFDRGRGINCVCLRWVNKFYLYSWHIISGHFKPSILVRKCIGGCGDGDGNVGGVVNQYSNMLANKLSGRMHDDKCIHFILAFIFHAIFDNLQNSKMKWSEIGAAHTWPRINHPGQRTGSLSLSLSLFHPENKLHNILFITIHYVIVFVRCVYLLRVSHSIYHIFVAF